jgi:hypothetical protein
MVSKCYSHAFVCCVKMVFHVLSIPGSSCFAGWHLGAIQRFRNTSLATVLLCYIY